MLGGKNLRPRRKPLNESATRNLTTPGRRPLSCSAIQPIYGHTCVELWHGAGLAGVSFSSRGSYLGGGAVINRFRG